MNFTKQLSNKCMGVTQHALALPEARHIALLKQGLYSQPAIPASKQSIVHLVQTIGMVQLDPLKVVERSHYLTVFSRLGHYQRRDFDELVWPDQQIVEQWAHAASLVPSRDYKYFAPFITAQKTSIAIPRRLKKIGNRPEQVLELVVREIARRGALRARDFHRHAGEARTWWNRSPVREALHLLFRQGVLCIKERIGFEPAYDLIERYPMFANRG